MFSKHFFKDIRTFLVLFSEDHVNPNTDMSEMEQQWRAEALDYSHRFCGHCNTTTDIKEANFFGR